MEKKKQRADERGGRGRNGWRGGAGSQEGSLKEEQENEAWDGGWDASMTPDIVSVVEYVCSLCLDD